MYRNCRYINHPLNNSPSKNAYTFSKTQRFLTVNNEKSKGDESSKIRKNSVNKQPPSSETSFTKDSTKNKKQQLQRRYSSKERVRSVNRQRLSSKDQKKIVEDEKPQDSTLKREEESKIKIEQISKEDRFMKKKNIPPLLKTESLKRLPPRPPGRREFLKKEPCSTISKAKSTTPRYFQSQKKNAMAFTFSRSPRAVKDRVDPQLGPGAYDTISQFGDCSCSSSYIR